MPAPLTAQDQSLAQEILDLKVGLDRGGQVRSWAEVAHLKNRSQGYVRRVAMGGNATAIPRVRIDPRDYLPAEFAMSDHEVETWNASPRCLCGCGEATQQENGHAERMPYGAFRLFRGSHEKRMPWRRNQVREANRAPARRAKIGRTRRAMNIRAGVIAELLREWRIHTDASSFKPIATIAHLSLNHVNDIASGRLPRITPLTAAKVLVALNEPLREEIAREYRAWAQREGLDVEQFTTCE